MASDSTVRNVVVIGGGIVWCTTAFYLASHPQFAEGSTKITLLEASKAGVAQGASGKAGGLVAKWAYPKELVNVSFPEHIRLSKEHNGAERWGFRSLVGCGSSEGCGKLLHDETGSSVGTGAKRKSLEQTVELGEN